MKPISTKERLPMTVGDGKEDVWWFNEEGSSWSLGLSLLIDFDEPETYNKYTHWLPKDELPIPKVDINLEKRWNQYVKELDEYEIN